MVWHLTRNPPAKLANILTIGINEDYAFVIKDIAKLTKTYECAHCRARFTQAGIFNDTPKGVPKGKR